MLYVGGSSTGGAYQFSEDPEAFFAGQAHRLLCQKRSLHSHNYGNSDRDTHTISRTLPQMLDTTRADVIVLYVGHNDFGGNNPYTRKQREYRETSWLRALGGAARSLRSIAGVDLLFRHVQESQQPQLDGPPLGADGNVLKNQLMDQSYPFAVPLEDATSNLLQIADLAQQRGAKCLLVAQLLSSQSFSDLSEYWTMERELADRHPNIWFVDPRSALKDQGERAMLADNNHLSRRGHQALAKIIEQHIEQLLSTSNTP